MARRRKKSESGFEKLLAAPWWLSAILAFGAYAIPHWILPGVIKKGPLLTVNLALTPIANIVAIVLGLTAVVLFFRQKTPPPINFSAEPSLAERSRTPAPANDEALERAWRDIREPERRIEPQAPKPTAWSLDLLQQIEWNRFEALVVAYFREKGFRCEATPFGADGGVDASIYQGDQLAALVQCKAWNTRQVGAPQVREFYGVVTKENIGKGYFMATGSFSEDARAFANGTPIVLVDGPALMASLLKMAPEAQDRLLAVATEGDYMTPTCPSCGIKMRWIANGNFWGCLNYPRCKQKIHVSKNAS